MGEYRLYIPRRIQARWVKHHNLPQRKLYSYRFDSILETAKVNANEFRKFWAFLHPTLPADEIFSLFNDSGFSPKRGETTGKLAFVKKVLQYKKEQVFPPFFCTRTSLLFYNFTFLSSFALWRSQPDSYLQAPRFMPIGFELSCTLTLLTLTVITRKCPCS